jgi:hypothetical protein
MSKASESDLAAFKQRIKPDVSKVIALAFPQAEDQLKAAYAHNDKLGDKVPKHNRIGENNLLRIARGEITVDDVLVKKEQTKVNKTKEPSKLDQTFTPLQRLENSLAGAWSTNKVGTEGAPTRKQAMEAVKTTLEAYFAKLEEKKA